MQQGFLADPYLPEMSYASQSILPDPDVGILIPFSAFWLRSSVVSVL